jgi:hypothetical protein
LLVVCFGYRAIVEVWEMWSAFRVALILAQSDLFGENNEEVEKTANSYSSYREFRKIQTTHTRVWWYIGNFVFFLVIFGGLYSAVCGLFGLAMGFIFFLSEGCLQKLEEMFPGTNDKNCAKITCILILKLVTYLIVLLLCLAGGVAIGVLVSVFLIVKSMLTNTYFKDPWNFFELPILFLFFYWLVSYNTYHRIRKNMEPAVVQALNGNKKSFLPLHSIAYFNTLSQDTLSVLFMIVGLHLLRTMQLIPFGVGPRVMAITKTMRDRNILPFYLVLIVVTVIFSGGLLFAFGNEIIEYRFLSTSFETIFLAMFGDFSMPREQMVDANISLAYGFFVAVSILLTLVMMNIFIAVVSSVYETVENESERKYDRVLDEYMLDQIPYSFTNYIDTVDKECSAFNNQEDNWKDDFRQDLIDTKKGLDEQLGEMKVLLEKLCRQNQ